MLPRQFTVAWYCPETCGVANGMYDECAYYAGTTEEQAIAWCETGGDFFYGDDEDACIAAMIPAYTDTAADGTCSGDPSGGYCFQSNESQGGTAVCA